MSDCCSTLTDVTIELANARGEIGRLRAAICVWRFEDAPEAYQELSTNGGDEDWVAFIPDGFPGGVPYWMGDTADRGWCNIVDWYDVEGGRVVIGSHA